MEEASYNGCWEVFMMRPLVDSDYGYEVIEIPLRLIDQYPDHPFYVDDDDDKLLRE